MIFGRYIEEFLAYDEINNYFVYRTNDVFNYVYENDMNSSSNFYQTKKLTYDKFSGSFDVCASAKIRKINHKFCASIMLDLSENNYFEIYGYGKTKAKAIKHLAMRLNEIGIYYKKVRKKLKILNHT